MSDIPSAHPSIPFLKTDEEQLAKIRRQLEGIFREVRLAHDLMIVCGAASAYVNSDLDKEIEHVTRRCGADRLFTVLKTLTEIVERFGGRTEMSERLQSEKQHTPPEQSDS